MLEAVGLLILGVIVLLLGGEGTVRGGSALATRFNVQPYVVGATVVAFGTSAPELAVTLTAALSDAPGLALGNVVGSNIANLGLILGLSAIITPILINRNRVKRELPTVVGVVLLLLFAAWDRRIEQWEGVVLLVSMVLVMVRTMRKSGNVEAIAEEHKVHMKPFPAIAMLLAGLVGLFFGGRFLVLGAVDIAEYWGVPEWVIGVVIVAAGTSMPEVAASVVAAARGRGDIALGNVIGSNTFNVLMVLGAGAAIKPIRVKVDITFDLVVVSLLTLIPALTLLKTNRVPRAAGGVLLLGYLAYLVLKLVTG